MSPSPRLGRLLGGDGRCLDVAIDHGMFNEPGFLPGIEDMGRAIATVVRAGPDAVQLGPGHAPLLQATPASTTASSPAARRPALVMRADVTNFYGARLEPPLWVELLPDALEQAIRLDAACVVVFLLWVPGHAELHRQCVAHIGRLRADCERFGMPLMVEPLAFKLDERGGLAVDGAVDRIAALVRQAIELGADVVKADPTDDLADYPRIIEVAAGRPVLVRGGGKADELAVLRRTHAIMQSGASGIVYGRNIIQHSDPAAITRAFLAIVHDGATADEALRLIR